MKKILKWCLRPLAKALAPLIAEDFLYRIRCFGSNATVLDPRRVPCF